MKKAILLLAAVATLFSCTQKAAESGIETPTMGWSSWNTYRVNISDSLIMRQADAMVELGLDKLGYKYINIDDGYFGGRDSETGQLLIHPKRFPHGLRPVVDHIHSLGLKAGIYSDAGENTCGNYWDNDTIARGVGFYGHDQQDADFFFKELGFDFIKVDFCGGNAPQNHENLCLDPQERYTAIRAAMDATGREGLRLNVCRWDYPGVWVGEVASSWRISHDISSRWSSAKDIIHQNLYLSAYAYDGHYNDMDMLEVGRTLTEEEDRTHFGLWCIMSSPLLIGCDMTTLKPETLALLSNEELIALDQDPLGLQAYVCSHNEGEETYVLVKDILNLHGTTRAVAFYNEGDTPAEMTLDFSTVELGGDVKVRDLFEKTDMGTMNGSMSVSLPAHGCRIYRLEADSRLERTLYEAETAWLSDYQELYNNLVFKTAAYSPMEGASGAMGVTQLGWKPTNDLQWRDVYTEKGGRYKLTIRVVSPEERTIYLAVNDDPGRVLKIDTAGAIGEISAEVELRPGSNLVRLCNDRSAMPDVDCMIVEKL